MGLHYEGALETEQLKRGNVLALECLHDSQKEALGRQPECESRCSGGPGWGERDGWPLLVHILSLVLDSVVSGKLKGECVFGGGIGGQQCQTLLRSQEDED